MKRSIFLGGLCFLFLLVACSLSSNGVKAGTPLDYGLLGRWKEIGGTKTLQFFAEGTLITKDEGRSTSSFYRIVDRTSIKIEPKYAPRTQLKSSPSRVVQAAIHGDVLTLIHSGRTLKFIKID